MYVGFQAKLLLMASNVAPRVLDKVMQRYQYWSQQADRPARPREESALHQAGYGLHERGTHPGHVRRRSWYVTATTHPAATAGMATAAALTGAGVARARRRVRLQGPLRRLVSA